MGKKILLIEDDAHWRRLALESLEESGYQVAAVSGAAEAMLQKDLADVALIVLDLDLGGENGLMLMKYLKRQHPGAPIIIYTGMDPDQQVVQRIREQGASLFLRKGPMSELVAAIRDKTGSAAT